MRDGVSPLEDGQDDVVEHGGQVYKVGGHCGYHDEQGRDEAEVVRPLAPVLEQGLEILLVITRTSDHEDAGAIGDYKTDDADDKPEDET